MAYITDDNDNLVKVEKPMKPVSDGGNNLTKIEKPFECCGKGKPETFEFTTLDQHTRTYYYPHVWFTIKDVISINVSDAGTHRLNTQDGKKHIVLPGWIHLEFDTPEWTAY
jgi:hypothetical protein